MEILHEKDVFSRLEDIYNLSLEAFSQAYLYEPIDFDDFKDIYIKGIEKFSVDLVIIYRKATPIAFSFCYEDPLKRFYVCKTIAIKKSERNKNVIFRLIDCSFEAMEQRGYDKVLLHFRNLKERGYFTLLNRTLIKSKKYALLEFKND